jgi:hypothetical protein
MSMSAISLYAQVGTMRRWFFCDGSQARVMRVTAVWPTEYLDIVIP